MLRRRSGEYATGSSLRLGGPLRTLRRLTVRATRAAYLGLERSGLGPLLNVGPVQRLKARFTYMPAWRVLAVLDVVAATGVQAWVAGGWGVDALVGRQTRRHYDLDLVIGDHPVEYLKVTEALGRQGFRLAQSQFNPGLPMPQRYAWNHDDGHGVEVLPVALQQPPFNRAEAQARSVEPAFTCGNIDGRSVPCLSAELQLALHTGYRQRQIDAGDISLLRALVG